MAKHKYKTPIKSTPKSSSETTAGIIPHGSKPILSMGVADSKNQEVSVICTDPKPVVNTKTGLNSAMSVKCEELSLSTNIPPRTAISSPEDPKVNTEAQQSVPTEAACPSFTPPPPSQCETPVYQAPEASWSTTLTLWALPLMDPLVAGGMFLFRHQGLRAKTSSSFQRTVSYSPQYYDEYAPVGGVRFFFTFGTALKYYAGAFFVNRGIFYGANSISNSIYNKGVSDGMEKASEKTTSSQAQPQVVKNSDKADASKQNIPAAPEKATVDAGKVETSKPGIQATPEKGHAPSLPDNPQGGEEAGEIRNHVDTAPQLAAGDVHDAEQPL